MEGMGFLWSLATILGPIVLIAVLGWAYFRRRKLTARERMAQKEGTERAYREPEEIN